MSTETTLLPCPHCCGKSEIFCEKEGTAWGGDGYWVSCRICLARIPMKESEKEAVNFWNLRTPQIIKVVAKPIEWGEWEDSPDQINRWKRSKCGKYDMHHDKALGEYSAFLDRTDVAINNVDDGTELEAEQVCQAHAQDKVDRFLLDCDIVIAPKP